MGWILGTDEAGYGPNLGPLVVACSLWHVDDNPDTCDLFARLAPEITNTPDRITGPLAFADSKQIYKPGGGLASLERGLWAASWHLGADAREPASLWRNHVVDGDALLTERPGIGTLEDCFTPTLSLDALRNAAEVFARSCEKGRVRLVAWRARVVFPDAFNRALDEHGNKSDVLSRTTLELVAKTLAHHVPKSDEPVLIQCDKHGGRNRYGGVLQEHFPEPFVVTRREGRELSEYTWRDGPQAFTARFGTKSERFLPAALASMAAKYLREVSMLAFNRYWQTHVPGLKPTAGYPLDAKRFFAEIREHLPRCCVSESAVWRAR